MDEQRPPAIAAGVMDRRAINLEAAETARVEAPAFDSLEEFFAWQRELYRPRAMSVEPMPGREVVADIRGRQLEILIYSLPPLKLITPFGVVVLIAKPDAGD